MKPRYNKTRRYIPLKSKFEILEIRGNSKGWKRFSEGILRNNHIRNYVNKCNGKACVVCGVKFSSRSKKEMHHTDYDWVCHFWEKNLPEDHNDISRKAHSSEKSEVPDCTRCREKCNILFRECTSRLVMVHAACHDKIHNA